MTCYGLNIVNRERTWVFCKPAWGLQMVPDVSMHHAQQFCSWNIADKRLGPPGTIHIVGYLQEPHRQKIYIFASNTHRLSGDHPQELLQKHQDVIMPTYPHRPCVIILGDLHCMPNDCIEDPSWIGSGVLQGSTGLRYNTFPFSICLTQDFPRSNAVHTLPWPAYSASGTLSSIGEALHWLPDKVMWPTSSNHGAVMPGNPGGLGWYPTGKNYSSECIHVKDMQSTARGTWFVAIIIDLAALNGPQHRVKIHNKLLASNA